MLIAEKLLTLFTIALSKLKFCLYIIYLPVFSLRQLICQEGNPEVYHQMNKAKDLKVFW